MGAWWAFPVQGWQIKCKKRIVKTYCEIVRVNVT